MDETPLFPFIVALSFAEGGPLYVNAVIAPNEAVAAGMVAIAFMQATPTDKPLNGVAVGLLTPEFMRMALRAHEGTLAPGGENVLSLVPQQALGEIGPALRPQGDTDPPVA